MSATLYEMLANEEDARACADISDAACREVPRNFGLMLLAQGLTKLGDALASPKTVLAWVMAAVGAPVALVGLMVPIRESGSLVPQLAIASWVRTRAVRKWVWITGSLIQATAVLGLAAVAVSLSGAAAGAAVLGLLGLFSLARGLSSVAFKDVLGKTIPKQRRGRLTGFSASGAGLVTIGAGGALLVPRVDALGTHAFGGVLAAAGLVWFAAALVFARIEEFPGETAGGRNALGEARQRLGLLATDAVFRRFVVARALALGSSLSAPYYIWLARDLGTPSAALLGTFVIAGGAAGFVAAPFWGRFADRSSRRVLAGAAAASAVIGAAVAAGAQFAPGLAGGPLVMPAAYFVLSVAHSGVRVGRKTYVVDLAAGNRRTDYVAVSNSVIGVVLLAAGLAGTAAQWVGVPLVVLVLSLSGLGAALTALRLPEVE